MCSVRSRAAKSGLEKCPELKRRTHVGSAVVVCDVCRVVQQMRGQYLPAHSQCSQVFGCAARTSLVPSLAARDLCSQRFSLRVFRWSSSAKRTDAASLFPWQTRLLVLHAVCSIRWAWLLPARGVMACMRVRALERFCCTSIRIPPESWVTDVTSTFFVPSCWRSMVFPYSCRGRGIKKGAACDTMEYGNDTGGQGGDVLLHTADVS